MTINIGDFDCHVVSGGRLRIDGGSMFGVVPKALWSRKFEPDDRNRIALATNCLLVRRAGKLVLIDTGYGTKAPPRQRDIFALESGRPLVQSLADAGVQPGDVDVVLLTHLHFDHAGGCTALDEGGRLRPSFPRARHFVQRAEWEDATAERPELAGAYFEQDFVPLADARLLELIDGDVELLPGLSCRLTAGHTRGHQVFHLQSAGRTGVYLGDLCPTSAHLRSHWTLAYDQFPLTVRRTKPVVLGEAADNDWLAFFDHDPCVPAARLVRDPKHEFIVRGP